MSLSRREMLALLFGAPIATEACRKNSVAIPGAIRGARVSVGHRLRDATVERAGETRTSVDVAVVGAGPSGLVAARRLMLGGIKNIAVFDLETQAGGTSCNGSDGVVPYPWGAHYLPLPSKGNRALYEFVSEIGGFEDDPVRGHVPREPWLVRRPEERLFFDGRWHSGLLPNEMMAPVDRRDFARFQLEVDRWIGWRDSVGKRAFCVPMESCSRDSEVLALDRISAATWLSGHGLSSGLLRWYVDYVCRDDYGLSSGETSAWAMMFYFASRTSRVGEQSAPFLTWPQGNGYLVSALSRPLGARLRLGALATDVRPDPDRVALSVFDVARGTLERIDARFVILAVPQFVAARILRPWREATPAHVAAFSYSSWLVANLHLRNRVESRGAPEAWDNVIYDSPSLGYITATHQRLADRGPTIWTYYNALVGPDPALRRQELYDADHASLAGGILADLEHTGPVREQLERVDIWRWGHAMVRPTVGFIGGQARRRASESVGRVYFAHSDLSGMALFEEAFDRGERAAAAIIERWRHQAP